MKTTKPPLGRGVRANAHNMEKEGVVDDVEPVEFSTLRKSNEIVMSKLIKKMSPLCSIYEDDFQNLAEEHKLGERKN